MVRRLFVMADDVESDLFPTPLAEHRLEQPASTKRNRRHQAELVDSQTTGLLGNKGYETRSIGTGKEARPKNNNYDNNHIFYI